MSRGFRCPACHGPTVIIDSRGRQSAVRRRRKCGTCRHRFTTAERVVVYQRPTTLTPAKIREIRRRFGTEHNRTIAADFAISETAVRDIGHRKYWKHVA